MSQRNNYLQENIKKLKEKRKKKKKIGGLIVDEDNFKAMLKNFNSSIPTKKQMAISKSHLHLTEIKKMKPLESIHQSNTDFSKNEFKR